VDVCVFVLDETRGENRGGCVCVCVLVLIYQSIYVD